MGQPEVKIRRAQARDMAFIIELWKKVSEEMARYDERYALRPEAEILCARWVVQRLRAQASVELVAEDGDDYVGYLVGHLEEAHPIFEHRRHGIITDIFVLPDFRRKSVAGRLFEEAERFFKEQDVEHLRINVVVKNAPSRAFCEKLGFGDFLHTMWKSM